MILCLSYSLSLVTDYVCLLFIRCFLDSGMNAKGTRWQFKVNDREDDDFDCCLGEREADVDDQETKVSGEKSKELKVVETPVTQKEFNPGGDLEDEGREQEHFKNWQNHLKAVVDDKTELMVKAAAYTSISFGSRVLSNDIFVCTTLEGTYGTASKRVNIYKWMYLSKYSHLFEFLLISICAVFILDIFWVDRTKYVLDFTCLGMVTVWWIFLTFFCNMKTLQQMDASLTDDTHARFGIMIVMDAVILALLWIFFIVQCMSGIPTIDFVRPLLVFVVDVMQVKRTLKLVAECMSDVRIAIALFFAVVCISAVLSLQLYRHLLKDGPGQYTADTYSKAFVEMFILLLVKLSRI